MNVILNVIGFLAFYGGMRTAISVHAKYRATIKRMDCVLRLFLAISMPFAYIALLVVFYTIPYNLLLSNINIRSRIFTYILYMIGFCIAYTMFAVFGLTLIILIDAIKDIKGMFSSNKKR